MGYWNATCMASDLPICHNDEVYLIVLAPTIEVDKQGPACYPDDRYVAVGFPILGKYDEYGGIEDYTVPYWQEEFFKRVYKYWSKKTSLVDGKWVEEYERYQMEDFETFIRDIVHRDVYIDVPMHGKKQLAAVLTHKDLYTRLVAEIAVRVPQGNEECFCHLHERKIRRAMAEYAEAKADGDILTRFHDIYLQQTKYRNLSTMADIYLETKENDIIHGLINYRMWLEVMMLGRKSYCCASGCGSQDVELKLHKIIAEFILERCEREVERAIENGNMEPWDHPDNALREGLLFWN